MKRALALTSLLLAIAAPFGAHAADVSITVAGYQFVPGGYLTADPLGATSGAATVALPNGTPLDGPTIHRGDRLTFANKDAVPHSVKWLSGPTTWTDVPLAAGAGGALSTTTFAPGAYVYQCGIHRGMRGSFKVTA